VAVGVLTRAYARGRVVSYLKRHHIGLLALFIALGGTSYAAVNLPRNSVGNVQLRKGAVTNSKLSRGVQARLKKAGKAGPRARRETPARRARKATPAHKAPAVRRASRA
jgi:hypothetical protein